MTKVEIKTKAELEENIKNGVSLIKVGAAWCGPCNVTQKNIEGISDNYKDVKFLDIDSEEADEELVSYLSVFNLPTILIFKDSEQVYRHVGLMNRAQLTTELNKYV
jgi:thioredoxin 1